MNSFISNHKKLNKQENKEWKKRHLPMMFTSLMNRDKHCDMTAEQPYKTPTQTDSMRNYLIFWKWAKSRKAYVGLRLCVDWETALATWYRSCEAPESFFLLAKAVNTLIREDMITKQRMTSFCECRNVQTVTEMSRIRRKIIKSQVLFPTEGLCMNKTEHSPKDAGNNVD